MKDPSQVWHATRYCPPCRAGNHCVLPAATAPCLAARRNGSIVACANTGTAQRRNLPIEDFLRTKVLRIGLMRINNHRTDAGATEHCRGGGSGQPASDDGNLDATHLTSPVFKFGRAVVGACGQRHLWSKHPKRMQAGAGWSCGARTGAHNKQALPPIDGARSAVTFHKALIVWLRSAAV